MSRPKLHYTDRHVVDYNTTNGHRQRTSSQRFYNKFATSQCQSPTSRHVKMLGCGKFLSVGGDFVVQKVVELLWARPLVVSVGGVRSRQDVAQQIYGRVVRHYNLLWACPFVVFVGAVRSRCPYSGVWALLPASYRHRWRHTRGHVMLPVTWPLDTQ